MQFVFEKIGNDKHTSIKFLNAWHEWTKNKGGASPEKVGMDKGLPENIPKSFPYRFCF